MKKILALAMLAWSLGVGGAVAQSKVQLMNVGRTPTYHNPGSLRGDGYWVDVLVQNIGYHKEVGVVFQQGAKPWQYVPAMYAYTLAPGWEVWRAQEVLAYGQSSATLNHPFIDYAGPVRMALNYRVNGQSYWDNNHGADYLVPETNTAVKQWEVWSESLPVVLLNARAPRLTAAGTDFTFTIAVKNLAYHKQVGIVFSDPRSGQWSVAQAYYEKPLVNGWEQWGFEMTVPGLSDQSWIEFAVFYAVNNQTYWHKPLPQSNYRLGLRSNPLIGRPPYYLKP